MAPRKVFCIGIVMLLLAGCAGRRLPPPAPEVSPRERRLVIAQFEEMRTAARRCGCCLDAAVNVRFTVAGFWGGKTGVLDGYLQAMTPAYLKLIGVNPLGQPLLFLVTDGHRFQYVPVSEGKVFEGATRSKTFIKYAPPGVRAEHFFYWLTGRLRPGPLEIVAVRRPAADRTYWLELERRDQFDEKGIRSHLLIDLDKKIVLRHIVREAGGRLLAEVGYDDHTAGEGCRLPRRITINSPQNRAEVEIELSDLMTEVAWSPDDFNLALPAAFMREVVD